MKNIGKDKNLISIYIVYSVVFFSLLCLGMWQLNKHYAKSYKKNLIAIKLKEEPKDLNNLNLEGLEIVKIKGKFLETKSIFFEPRTYKGKIGYHKLTPIKVDEKYFLVNRGFTIEKKINETSINNIDVINGIIINFPKPKFFELKNDIKKNQWHTVKIEDISQYLNLKLEPFLIYEINNSDKNIINVRPNYLSEINHLNYAITWFMLAITLSFILVFFVRKKSHV